MEDVLKWLASQARWHNACGLESMAVDFLRAFEEIKYLRAQAAENHRLRAIVEPLEILRQSPGASVQIFSDLGFRGVPCSAIVVFAEWTYNKPIPFNGATLADALGNALKAREAARKGMSDE